MKNSIIFLLFIALLNVIGIGILLPVLPFIVQQYTGAENVATAVGWLASIYAICQFIAAPLLGLLSDRYGRRPILLICLLGSACGYILFGLGGSLWVLFLGRIIDGLTGGDFSVLSAYIADSTKPEERGKYFGWLGAVAGFGFIAGPIIGGFAAKLGYQAPVFIAALLTMSSLLWGYFFLPESLKQKQAITEHSLANLNPFKHMRAALALPQLRWLLIITFLYALPFTAISTNTTILAKDSLGWDADGIGLLFLVIGSIDILMQGFLVGKLLPIFGEGKLTLAGLACEGICCALMACLRFSISLRFCLRRLSFSPLVLVC